MVIQFEVGDRVSGVVTNVMGMHGLPIPRESSADLFAAGLNSVAMVALMLAVENEFNITIPTSDLVPKNFRSVRSVEKLVIRLQRGEDQTR
jgi:acyl carrier protein